MAGETTTEESEEVEVDDEWERAMSNSTATAGSVKMVACPYDGCPWFSSKRKRLERHLLTHTGERPFACQVALVFAYSQEGGVMFLKICATLSPNSRRKCESFWTKFPIAWASCVIEHIHI